MNIPKAIEVFKVLPVEGQQISLADRFAACELGIEALKFVEMVRPCLPALSHKLLPGETTE